MSNSSTIIDKITKQGILPCFSHDSLQTAMNVIAAMRQGGVQVMEYTSRGEAGIRNLAALKKTFDKELVIGAGTVKDVQDARRFMEAGADFIVSPVIDNALCEYFERSDAVWIPSAITRNELKIAQQCSCPFVKIFPAYLYGPPVISEIIKNFPEQKFIPTGGIGISRSELKSWFAAGVPAVGIGSSLVTQSIIQKEDYADLVKQTSNVLSLIAQIKYEVIKSKPA